MTKLWQSVLACIAVGVLTVAGAPPAVAQDGGPDPTTASPQERVNAEVLPGISLLTVGYSGLLVTSEGRQPLDIAPAPSCTGFMINPNGYVATAAHCVDPQMIVEQLADVEATNATVQGEDPEAARDKVITDTTFEGAAPGSPPVVTVTVQRAQADGSATSAPMPAQIVDYFPLLDGDVALLKVNATNLPSVEVVPTSAVNPGTPIMTFGYPGATDGAVEPNLVPTWKDGTASRMQTRPGSAVPVMEITAMMLPGMSGGPTVNHQGQVVGVNSFGTPDEGGAGSVEFVAPSSTLIELLGRNGVRAEAGPADLAYRAGLDEYYSGHYSDAQQSFERVVALQPGNRQAAEFRTKALQAHERFGDRGLGVLGWSLIGGAVLLVLVAGLVTFLVRRRRHRAPTPDGRGGPPPDSGPVPTAYGPPSTPYPAAQAGPTIPSHPAPTRRTPDAPAHRVGAATRADPPTAGRPTAVPATPSDTIVTARTERVGPGRPPAGVSAGAATTPVVGKTTKHCRRCGAPRDESARFCAQCGAGAS